MKLYHDYTEKERANMTAEQVTALLDTELMSEGVLKPTPPKLQELQVPDIGKRKTYWRMASKNKYGSETHLPIAFADAEQATQFLALQPVVVDYDWECGGQEYSYGIPAVDCTLSPVELFDQATINKYRSQLVSNKAAAEANKKLQEEYNAAFKLASRVNENVWDDWNKCLAMQSNHQKVLDTMAEYTRLTAGDAATATKFLRKVYTDDKIDAAFDWFDQESPLAEKPMAAEVATA